MSLQVAAVDPHVLVPEEERPAARKGTFRQLVSRLSHQSVVKHFDAYADIAWDAEEFRIDPLDPRWELAADDVLGAARGTAPSRSRCARGSVSTWSPTS